MLNRHVYAALTLLALGCSSTDDPEGPGDARADQVTPDAKADQVAPIDAKADQTTDTGKSDAPIDAPLPDADAARDGEGGPACQSVAVGRATDRGFTIHASGGMPPGPTDAGGCAQRDFTTTYDFAAKTVTRRGCNYGIPPFDETYRLSQSEVSQIRAELVSFQTTCQLGCGADLPRIEISVNADSGGVRHYQSAFEAACPGRPVDQSPAFDITAFFGLDARLDAILNICVGDGGTVSDAAAADAGPSDASVSDAAAIDSGSAPCTPRERVYPSDGGDAAIDVNTDVAVDVTADVAVDVTTDAADVNAATDAAVDATSDVAANDDASGG